MRELKVGDVLSDVKESQHWHKDIRCVVTSASCDTTGKESEQATGIMVAAASEEPRGDYPKFIAYSESYLVNSINPDQGSGFGYVR